MTASSTSATGLTQFREPFTFDTVLGILGKVPFSTPFLALLPALTLLYHKHTNPTLAIPTTYDKLLPLLRSLVFTQYKWVGYIWSFILIRTINRALNRYNRNHTEWRRDPIDYANDIVVITGGSQGIGKEIVQLLSHKKKAHIAVLDMAPPAYIAAPAGAPEILYFKTDVSNREQMAEVGKKIRAGFGGKKVGVLINCAGVASGNTILDVDLDSAERLWRINTLANWITAKEFAPDMIARNHGHIVTVSSAGAYATLPSMSEYATSKAAALAFHECLAIEMRTRYNALAFALPSLHPPRSEPPWVTVWRIMPIPSSRPCWNPSKSPSASCGASTRVSLNTSCSPDSPTSFPCSEPPPTGSDVCWPSSTTATTPSPTRACSAPWTTATDPPGKERTRNSTSEESPPSPPANSQSDAISSSSRHLCFCRHSWLPTDTFN